MMKPWLIVVGIAVLAAGALTVWLRAWWRREHVRQRWETWSALATRPAGADDIGAELASPAEIPQWLGRWLYVAGYRQPWATAAFVAATAGGFFVGLGLALGMRWSGLQQIMERNVALAPGGVGETFLPVVWVAPWLLLVMLTLLPLSVVRRARRLRVELIEQDLPLALELLATLSEAGLAFDAALQRILRTRLSGRPLSRELQIYQADLLAGRTRVDCLRRLSARIVVPSVSVFVSALAQAEQLGMGIARVLRQQADDVRSLRRERAIAFANALPVKRVIPLVICFLPGLFVWTLGPAFVQLFKMVDTFLQTRLQ